MSRTEDRLPPADNGRPEQRRWLVPLLWILIPVVAAVVTGVWQQRNPEPQPPWRPLPLLTLTGDARRDRRAILERAADLLVPPVPTTAYVDRLLPNGASLLSAVGLELLPLDPARGAECVRHSMEMASGEESAEAVYDLDAPGRSYVGRLVRLAASLKQYPALAEESLRTAYGEAQRSRFTEGRIDALCVFVQEAARIDPVRARSAVQQAEAAAATLPRTAPAESLAAVAAAVARVEGAAAARPLVDRALQQIPSGAARPLVEARLAALLVNAAPARAGELARRAVADVGRSSAQASKPSGLPETAADPPKTQTSEARRYFGVDLQKIRAAERRKPRAPERPKPRVSAASLAWQQYRALAITLAASHPEAALAAIARIPAPGAREALFRRAVRAAVALPSGRQRRSALIKAADGLAVDDFVGAPIPLLGLPAPVPRTAPPPPPAAASPAPPPPGLSHLGGSPSSSRRIEGDYDNSLPEVVATEPDLGRALAMAERAENVGPAPEALLTVARRLRLHGEAPRTNGPARSESRQRTAPP